MTVLGSRAQDAISTSFSIVIVIALLEAHRAGLLRRESALSNVMSGATVGVAALPLAMAFVIASARNRNRVSTRRSSPALLSRRLAVSRLQITGPDGAFIVILAGITANYGIDGLQIATLMAGPSSYSASRIGAVIKFIPAL
jgi:SulP family sulfate permease